MSTDQTMKGLLITDEALIKKLKEEIRLKGVYIPPQRDSSTMDMEALKTGTHVKSIDMIGQQSAISITVNENDPEKESADSVFRLHLRVADGVHRWKETQSKGKDPVDELQIKFYQVKDFEEYAKLKALLDTKKADNPMERKLDIETLCDSVFKSGTPREKVSAAVKKLLAGIVPESTLNEFIPPKYKEEAKQRKTDKKKEDKPAEVSTKLQEERAKFVAEITQLTKENTKLTKDNEELKTEVKQLNEIISVSKLEKTVNVDGLENVQVAVSFNAEAKEFVVRKV